MKVSIDGQCLSAAQVPASRRRFAWEAVAALSRWSTGVDVEILTLDRDVDVALSKARIRSILVHMPPPSEDLAPQSYAQRVNRAYRAAWLGEPPDIILLPDVISPEIAPVESYGGIPIIAVVAGKPAESEGGWKREAALARLQNLRDAQASFLVTSLALRDWLSNFAQMPAQRIETIPTPVNRRWFADEQQVESKRPSQTILTAACPETTNGLPVVFRAFRSLGEKFSKVSFSITVDPEDARLQRAVGRVAEAAGIEKDRWRFVSDDDAEFARELNDSLMFVYLPSEDYIGSPMLHALACGCPVLCSDTGALPELAGTAAQAGPSDDPHALAERMERLLRNGEDWESWAAKGPPRARKYDARQCAARLVQTIHKVHKPVKNISGDLRAAYISPFPPAATGIGRYSLYMARELREYVNLDVYPVSQEDLDPVLKTRFQLRDIKSFPAAYRQYDIVVYNMGNNREHHEQIFELLQRYPGVAILHDINLHGFFYSGRSKRAWLKRLQKPKGSPNVLHSDPYYQEMAYCYGAAGAEEAQRVLRENREPDQNNLYLNRRVTRRSRGIAVHSRWAAKKVLENGDSPSVFVMPHGIQVSPQRDQETEKDFRKTLRDTGADILIAVAGFMNFNRRLETVYRSVKELKDRGLKPALTLIGRIDPALMRHCQAMAKELDIADLVVHTGYIKSYETFLGHISAVDVVVNLRYPTAGETSGVSQTAMALSKPLIVSDTPANADIPTRAAFKVKPDDLEIPTLAAALEALARDSELREAMGKAGHVHVAQTASWSLAGRMFSQYLYEVARRYDYAPSAE